MLLNRPFRIQNSQYWMLCDLLADAWTAVSFSMLSLEIASEPHMLVRTVGKFSSKINCDDISNTHSCVRLMTNSILNALWLGSLLRVWYCMLRLSTDGTHGHLATVHVHAGLQQRAHLEAHEADTAVAQRAGPAAPPLRSRSTALPQMAETHPSLQLAS